MGCASCGQPAGAVQTGRSSYRQANAADQVLITGPCAYTVDQLKVWVQTLTCFQQKGLYIPYNVRPADLNKALGGVKSAINYPTFPCYYQKELNFAQGILNIAISTGQC
jgi:hypothetical protein